MGPIRVLIGILGADQHEVSAALLARALRDAGMEVLYLGCLGLPNDVLEAAVEEGVDVIGLACHSQECLGYLERLSALLRGQGLEIPVVVAGPVVAGEDARGWGARGAAAAFGPTAGSAEIVAAVTRLARASDRA